MPVTRIGGVQIFAEIKRSERGSTYRGLESASHRLVLVKTFVRNGDPAVTQSRFEQEAAIYAKIDHPNVVRLLNYGIDDGLPFLTLEFVEGQDLRSLLESLAPGEGLPLEISLTIFRAVLEGAEEIHHRNFIHRDLKPENILIGNDGSVKICDFDLATREGARGSAGLTGSPGYLPPEVILGEKSSTAADVFSLGVLLYEMLAGVRPFHSSSSSGEMNAIVRVAHLRLSKVNHRVPPQLDELVNRLLAKKPYERMGSARQILTTLTSDFVIGSTASRRQLVQKYVAAPHAYQPLALHHIIRPGRVRRRAPGDGDRAKPRYVRPLVVLGGILAVGGLLYWRLSPTPDQRVRTAVKNGGGAVEKQELPAPNNMRHAEAMVPSGAATPVRELVASVLQQQPADSATAAGATAPSAPPQKRAIIVQSHPWAYVFIDGDSIGMTPLRGSLHLDEGIHELTFKNPSFPVIVFPVKIDARSPDTLTCSLWEYVAQLEVSIAPWAEMYVNGDPRELPVGERSMILRPGKYSLRFVHPQLGEKAETILLHAGEIRRLDINMFQN